MRALLFLSLFLPITAAAEPIPLTATEIRALLTGNTAIGTWVDHDYRQWFTDGGTTYYAPKHGRSTRGRWRVNDVTDEYESEWGESGTWDGYGIIKDGDTYLWITDGIDPQAFTVLPGEHLVWPKD